MQEEQLTDARQQDMVEDEATHEDQLLALRCQRRAITTPHPSMSFHIPTFSSPSLVNTNLICPTTVTINTEPSALTTRHYGPTRASLCARKGEAFCLRTQFKNFVSMVSITVGPQNTSFNVHRALLTRHSPFFAAALNGAFANSHSQTVHLPDVEPKHFEHVVLWLYTGCLEEKGFFFKDNKPTFFTLLDLYALADRLDVEGMRNALCDRIAIMAEETNSVPTPADTYILYEGVRESAPVRALVLDLFCFKKTDNLIATHPDDWHPTFLRELVCKLKRPGLSALTRHELVKWKAPGWKFTMACEICRRVLKPGVMENQCSKCKKGFCEECVTNGFGGGGLDWSVAERECKPWLGEICVDYHEHTFTEVCRLRLGKEGSTGKVSRVARGKLVLGRLVWNGDGRIIDK